MANKNPAIQMCFLHSNLCAALLKSPQAVLIAFFICVFFHSILFEFPYAFLRAVLRDSQTLFLEISTLLVEQPLYLLSISAA